jgi:hypothetical protein
VRVAPRIIGIGALPAAMLVFGSASSSASDVTGHVYVNENTELASSPFAVPAGATPFGVVTN